MKKNMLKKVTAAALAGTMAVTLLAGCGSGSGSAGTASDSGSGSSDRDFVYRVGFVNIDDGDTNCYPAMINFKNAVESDEFAAAVGADKVEVYTADSALAVDKQANNVETMLTKGVDMIFMIGVDTAGNTTCVEQCNAEGVDVFMVGTEASGGDWKFVGFDETDLGRHQGEWCVANLKENAKICLLEGKAGREASELRKQGFIDAIAAREDLEVISSQPGDFETEESMRVTEDWIQQYGDEIDCIVASDNFMCLGATEALKAAGMTDVVTCGVVGSKADAEQVLSGSEPYGVFVYWPTIGNLCAEVAKQVYLGEEVAERNNIELFDMTIDNAQELVDEYITEE